MGKRGAEGGSAMRRVDRASVAIPSALDGPAAPAAVELQKALNYYRALRDAGNEKGTPSYEFDVYRDQSVRDALAQLFHGKCAYCESRYDTTQPVDIEHWRPKARVVVSETPKRYRYGYYWLAADWNNLLPACIDCNRQRTHEGPNGSAKVTLGKADWFPLMPPSARAADPPEITGETPLLIDPCRDNPSDDLAFHEEGYVYPKNQSDELSRERALASIRFYALNRPGLIKARLEFLALMKPHMKTIRSLTEFVQQSPANQHAAVLEVIKDEIIALESFREPSQPYSAMADWYISEFRKTLS